MSEKKVPKLRFPEFSGEWVQSSIGKLCQVKTGAKDTQNKVEDGLYPFFVRSDNIERINSYSYDGEAILTAGDGVGVGKIFHYFNGKFDYHQRVYNIHDFKNACGRYVYYYFSNSFYNHVSRLSAKNSVDSVRRDMIVNMPISIPILEEQTKIAHFLTGIDDKIQQLTKKKELLEQYKKGVTQQIFSQQIRFKDDNGNDYPDWQIQKLGEIAKIFDGTHQTPVYVEHGIPFYSVENVTANNFIKTKFISPEVFSIESKRVKIEQGNILMTRIGDIGTTKYIESDVNASFYVSLALIKVHDIKINPRYIYHFINTNVFQSELWNRTIHVAFPKKINLGEIGNCLIKYPLLEEQTKIADFLTSIDDKITQITSLLKQTKLFKKSLLQQMFI